jgi:hypothetical protein
MTNEELADALTAVVLRQDSQDLRLRAMADEIHQLRSLVTAETKKPSGSMALPSADELEQLYVQVFHNDPARSPTDRRKRGSHEWSVKIEFWTGGAKQSIDLAMFSIPEMLKVARAKNSPFVDKLTELVDDDLMGSFVRRKLFKQGRGYVTDQAVLLHGVGESPDKVALVLWIGDDPITVTGFQPSAGEKSGRSLYFAKWKPGL